MKRSASTDLFSLLRYVFSVTPWWMVPVVSALAYAGCFALLRAASLSIETACTIGGMFGGAVLLVGLSVRVRMLMNSRLVDGQRDLDAIRKLDWREFERLIAGAYARRGYRIIETGGGGPDGGVDVILRRGSEKLLVQCKHWRRRMIGVATVRELHGLTHSKQHSGSRGILVASGSYTADAVSFARQNDVELIDGRALWEMIKDLKTGECGSGSEYADNAPHTCPSCGMSMVVRKARYGRRAGSRFWGCSGYPSCRQTLDYLGETGTGEAVGPSAEFA